MRVLICGDRHWSDWQAIDTYVSLLPVGSVVIQGEAPGADSAAREAAVAHGYAFESYPADWAAYGRAAGPIRNKQMLTEGQPDLVVAFHDDLESSKGTMNMISQARKAGVPVQIHLKKTV